MRRVKFRGKILKEKGLINAGEWIEGGYYRDDCYGGCPEGKHYIIQWNSGYGGFTDLIEVDGETVEQRVGIIGDRKLHLWEGDIVTDNIGTGKVVYSEGRGAYRVTYGDGNAKWLIDYTDEELKAIVVIGNIHEHAELIKEASQ